MADAPVFRAIITAVDNATAVLDRIGRKITMVGDESRRQARVIWAGQPPGGGGGWLDRIAESFAAAHGGAMSFGEAMHRGVEPHVERVHRLHEAVDSLGEGFGHVREMITEILTPLAAFGSVASVAGLFELVHGVAERSGEMDHMAASLAMTRGELGRLIYVAKQTDTPIESMETAMGKLGKAIAGAASGKNKDAANLFGHLGISLKDTNGHLLTAIGAFPKLQDAFQHTTDATMRQRMAFALFGRGGLDMMGMMMLGAKETDELGKRFKSLTYGMTHEDKEGLEQYKSNWIDLGVATNAFTNELGAGLAPVLTPLVERMTAFLGAHRADIVERFTGAVRDMRDWLYSVDWGALGRRIDGFFRPLKDLWHHYGSLERAMWGVIFVITGPWLAAAWSLAASLVKVGWGVANLAFGFGTTLVRAIVAATGAMEGFNTILMRSPIWRTVTALLMLKDVATGKIEGREATAEERKRLPRWDPNAPSPTVRAINSAWDWLTGRPDDSAAPPRQGGIGALLDQAFRLPDFAPAGMPGMPPPSPGQAGGEASQHNPFAGLMAFTRLWTEAFLLQHADAADDAGTGAARALALPAAPSPFALRDMIAQPGGSADRDAQVEVRVTFDNAPPGVSATATSTGPVRLIAPDVGRAMPDTGPPGDNPLLHLNPAAPFR